MNLLVMTEASQNQNTALSCTSLPRLTTSILPNKESLPYVCRAVDFCLAQVKKLLNENIYVLFIFREEIMMHSLSTQHTQTIEKCAH